MARSRKARIWMGVAAGGCFAAAFILIMFARRRGAGTDLGGDALLAMLPLMAGFLLLMTALGAWSRAGTRSTREPPILGGLCGIGMFLVMMPAMQYARGGSLLAAILQNSHMALIMTPLFLWPLARRRISTAPACANCGYLMDKEVQGLDDPRSRCPECGSYWKLPGKTVTERTRWRPWVAAVLVVIGITGLVSVFSTLGRAKRTQLAVLPTSSLIQEVTAATRGFTMDEWTVLSKRTLSPEQKVRLAEGLLELRARRQYLDHDAERWLEAAALAEELPAEIVERYFRGMLEVWIDAPDRVTAGAMISVAIGSEDRSSLRTPTATTLNAFVVFNGFGFDGGPLEGGIERSMYSRRFGRVQRSFGKLAANNSPGPEVEAEARAPGEMAVRAEYWLVLAPVASLWDVSWRADGTPVTPPGTAWCEKVVVEKRVWVDAPAGGAR